MKIYNHCFVLLEALYKIFLFHKLLESSFFIFTNLKGLFMKVKALDYKINMNSLSNISTLISIIRIEIFHGENII